MIVHADQIRATLPPEDRDAEFEPRRARRWRNTTGRRSRPLTAVAEDAEWLARHGVSLEDAVTRMDFASRESLRRSLTRAGRIDLFEALSANDPLTYKPWRFQ